MDDNAKHAGEDGETDKVKKSNVSSGINRALLGMAKRGPACGADVGECVVAGEDETKT